MIRELLAVGGGGALGSICRYALSYGLLAGQTICGFPAGTFTVNAVGSLLIGLLLEVLDSQTAAWLLVVGSCGCCAPNATARHCSMSHRASRSASPLRRWAGGSEHY